jgi:hypothetical protein
MQQSCSIGAIGDNSAVTHIACDVSVGKTDEPTVVRVKVFGSVAEWLNAAVLKTAEDASPP